MKQNPISPPAGLPTVPFTLVLLATLCGMEVLRGLFPLSLYVLRDRLDWTAVQAGLVIFALFLVAFTAAGLRRLFSDRALLLATAGLLGLARLLLQLWTGDPILTLVLAWVGGVGFWLFWPILLASLQLGTRQTAGCRLATAILAGLLLDTTLTGLYGTYDRMWAGGALALAITLLVVGLLWLSLFSYLRRIERAPRPDLSWPRAGLWLALGPFLMLQFILLQNPARLNTLTGWGLPATLAWLLLAHLLGLALANALPTLRAGRWLVAITALVPVLALFIWPWSQGWTAAIQLLVTQTLLAGALALALGSMPGGGSRKGLARLTITNAVSGLLLVTLLFAFYIGFDMSIPLDRDWLPALAGLLVVLPGLAAAIFSPREAAPEVARVPAVPWRVVDLAFGLLLIPLVMAVTRPEPAPVAAAGPVRVVNYNLHNGFSTAGRLDLETLARVIENESPDVVALQEVSRGWVLNGSVDMLDWLAHRLDMAYVFGPTADPLWGNAVLSRYPIQESENVLLPPDDLLIPRGYLRVVIATGDGADLTLWNTHLHHLQDESASAIRIQQVTALLQDWNGTPHALIVGDTNAEPDSPEMQLFGPAGFHEAVATAGIDPPFTNESDNPYRQIDYLWFSPDMVMEAVRVPHSLASDHFPIAATYVQKVANE